MYKNYLTYQGTRNIKIVGPTQVLSQEYVNSSQTLSPAPWSDGEISWLAVAHEIEHLGTGTNVPSYKDT